MAREHFRANIGTSVPRGERVTCSAAGSGRRAQRGLCCGVYRKRITRVEPSIHERKEMIYRGLMRGCDGELLPITLAQVSAIYHLVRTKSMCPLEPVCLPPPLQAAFHIEATPFGGQTPRPACARLDMPALDILSTCPSRHAERLLASQRGCRRGGLHSMQSFSHTEERDH